MKVTKKVQKPIVVKKPVECSKAECPKAPVKKVAEPQWLIRVKAELRQLLARFTAIQAMLEKLQALIKDKKATAKDKENFRLLSKQQKAMAAYKAVLEERIAKA